jgi:hypothetical protein
MGGKSPKATQKQAAQKQAKATATKQKAARLLQEASCKTQEVASDDRCGRTPGSLKLRFPQGKLS